MPTTSPVNMRIESRARWYGLLGAAVTTFFLAGCAQPAVAPRTEVATPTDTRTLAADRALLVWQARLAEHVARAGHGDPAILGEQPMLRSPTRARPAQIVFGVTDIDAIEDGRDGFDAVGLKVGRHADPTGVAYVFMVGIIERSSYRPVALIDLRMVTMLMHQGAAIWVTGPSDAQALALYDRHRDTDTALRFPALRDQFTLERCASGLCVREHTSGARWSLN